VALSHKASLVACATLLAACGGARTVPAVPTSPAPFPTAIGTGPRFQPGSHASALGGPRVGLACREPGRPGGSLVHLELFAERKVVLVAEGIGIAPPLRRGVQRIASGRCRYPVATFDRTGTLDVTREGLTLGDLFAVWSERLSKRRLLSFGARRGTSVRAFVDGREWTGDPRAIRLARHAEIVLEVSGYVPPHRFYLFPR
jgi:hypothetical protein